ncbi:MAG: hypothetical protein HGA90_07810, partial [Alphaproteobacteria bacterium]|nr:hypothetical protein [Alphaproteobacteria bacterium]
MELAEQRMGESSMKGFGMFKRLSVVRAITLGYIVLIALFIAAAAAAGFAVNQVQQTADDVREDVVVSPDREGLLGRARGPQPVIVPT